MALSNGQGWVVALRLWILSWLKMKTLEDRCVAPADRPVAGSCRIWDVALEVTRSCNRIWDVALDVTWCCNKIQDVALEVTWSCNRIWDVALGVTWSCNRIGDVALDVTWPCNRACNVALDVAGAGRSCEAAKLRDATVK